MEQDMEIEQDTGVEQDARNPEDVNKYMFAEDLINYFMTENGFPPAFSRVTAEGNRHLVPRTFTDIIKIVTAFLYCRIAVFNAFRTFETRNMVREGSFYLFVQHLVRRYFPIGYNHQKFLYFCSQLGYMVKSFYKRGEKETPKIAVEHMVKVMKMYKLVESGLWNGLNIAAFKYLKIAIECGFVQASSLKSLKIQFIVDPLFIDHDSSDSDEVSEDDEAFYKQENDFLKQSSWLEKIIGSDIPLHNVGNQTEVEENKSSALHEDELKNGLSSSNNPTELEEVNLALPEEKSHYTNNLTMKYPFDSPTKAQVIKKKIHKRESSVLKELNDLKNRTEKAESPKKKDRDFCSDDEFKMRVPVADKSSSSGDIEGGAQNNKEVDSFIPSTKNPFCSAEQNFNETLKDISSNNQHVEDPFDELKRSDKQKESIADHFRHIFSFNIDRNEKEIKDLNECEGTFLTARENGDNSSLDNTESAASYNQREIKEKEGERIENGKNEELTGPVSKENCSGIPTNVALKGGYNMEAGEKSTPCMNIHKKHPMEINLDVIGSKAAEKDFSKSFRKDKSSECADYQSFSEIIHKITHKNTVGNKGQDSKYLDSSAASSWSGTTIKSFETQNISPGTAEEKDDGFMSSSELNTKSLNFASVEQYLFTNTIKKIVDGIKSTPNELEKQPAASKMITTEFNFWDKFVVDMVRNTNDLELYGETHANFISREDYFNSTFDILTIVHFMATNYGTDILDIEGLD